MRRNYALVFPLILLLSVAATCSSSAPAVDPLTISSPATPTDAAAALSALDTMQQAAHARALAARTAGTMADAQWAAAVRAQNSVQDTFRASNALLGEWNGLGSKPPDFDAALARFRAAVNALVAAAP